MFPLIRHMQVLLSPVKSISLFISFLGSVAYVSQQAWIQNCILQENILRLCHAEAALAREFGSLCSPS